MMRGPKRTGQVSLPESNDAIAVTGRRPRARTYWIIGAILLVLLLAASPFAFDAARSAPPPEPESSRPPTVDVEQGTLSGSRTIPGVLDYAASHELAAELSGTLTGAPAVGDEVGRGDFLYLLDNQGVYLFLGPLPAWRSFESGMSDGPDVQQLEENLRDLGFFEFVPDEAFDWDTKVAIMNWQEATGQEETGKIELGRVMFSQTAVRIAEVLLTAGSRIEPGTAVVRLSSLAQDVTADVKLADQQLAEIGKKVTVKLPGGAETSGTISGIGVPTERETNGSTSVVIPITIALDTPVEAAGFQKANITVDVPSETRENVLIVPLEALLALPEGGFGVERVESDGTTTMVPVTTGLFAGGKVEVSGDDLAAGDAVVVPKS